MRESAGRYSSRYHESNEVSESASEAGWRALDITKVAGADVLM